MDTYQWNCCRMCLSAQCLYPIFSIPGHDEKYTNIILNTTGLKVEQNDTLPQEICSSCITFINESVRFRKKCELSNKNLTKRTNKQFCDLIIEPLKIENISTSLKIENISTSIDISELIDDDNFNDYDDNITLDSLQNNFISEEKIETNGQTEIFETNVQDFLENRINNNKKKKLIKRETEKPKRKVRKKENGKVEKKKDGERVKESIECEYCHKILTSKLSLRNHYKIHTGFDVVCEHCGKKFITRRLLLMHCRAKHGYEKTDKCSYCDYKASNAEQVKIHERLHTGEKPYVCSECSAGFHRKSSYLQHVAIHLPEKTVQCDQCPARFKSVTLMRIHKNRHRAPQYTFKCRVCDNSFARRRNVARHLHRIHALPPAPTHFDRVKIA